MGSYSSYGLSACWYALEFYTEMVYQKENSR